MYVFYPIAFIHNGLPCYPSRPRLAKEINAVRKFFTVNGLP